MDPRLSMTDEQGKQWKAGYVAGVLAGYTEGIGAVLKELSENHRTYVNPETLWVANY